MLSTRIWKCHLHSSPTASGHSFAQPVTSPSRPTPPSLNSLLNQDMPPADHKNFEKKCATCLAVLHSNTVSVRYNVCKKYFHQKCSTGPRALTRDNLWNCDKCSKLQQNLSTTSTNCQVPGPTNSTPSQPLPLAVCNKLKVYQWNADGIRPKFLELRDQ